jgi:hypothetical protein
VLAASIIRAMMMETASTSEKSVNYYQTTRRYNPEDSHLHTHRSEYLKSCLPMVAFYCQCVGLIISIPIMALFLFMNPVKVLRVQYLLV